MKESECACCITLSCMKLNCQPICHARKSCRPYLGYRPFSSLGYFRKSCESTWRTCIDLYCVTLTYVRLRSGHMTQERGLLDPIDPLSILMTSQSISYGFMYMYTCWQPRPPLRMLAAPIGNCNSFAPPLTLSRATEQYCAAGAILKPL